MWVWRSASPTAEAIVPLQRGWLILVAAAVIGAVGRVVIENVARVYRPGAMTALEKEVPESSPGLALTGKLPMAVRVLGSAVFSTFLLSGLLLRWSEALLVAVALAVLYFLRSGLYLKLPELWVNLLSRFPLLLRLVVAVVFGLFLARQAIGLLWKQAGDSFLAVIAGIAVSVIVIFLLCPAEAERFGQAAPEGDKES